MSKLIPPSPGRVVWYYPSQQEIDARSVAVFDQTQPLAATVAFVYNDRLVNLSVVDQAGAQFRRTSVKLLQEDDERPHTSEGPFAEWMPFQRVQDDKQSTAKEPCRRWAQVGDGWSQTNQVGDDIGLMFDGAAALAVCIQPVDLTLDDGRVVRLWSGASPGYDEAWQKISEAEYLSLKDATAFEVEERVYRAPSREVHPGLREGLNGLGLPAPVLEALSAVGITPLPIAAPVLSPELAAIAQGAKDDADAITGIPVEPQA